MSLPLPHASTSVASRPADKDGIPTFPAQRVLPKPSKSIVHFRASLESSRATGKLTAVSRFLRRRKDSGRVVEVSLGG